MPPAAAESWMQLADSYDRAKRLTDTASWNTTAWSQRTAAIRLKSSATKRRATLRSP
jgi:hypothetical protein